MPVSASLSLHSDHTVQSIYSHPSMQASAHMQQHCCAHHAHSELTDMFMCLSLQETQAEKDAKLGLQQEIAALRKLSATKVSTKHRKPYTLCCGADILLLHSLHFQHIFFVQASSACALLFLLALLLS